MPLVSSIDEIVYCKDTNSWLSFLRDMASCWNIAASPVPRNTCAAFATACYASCTTLAPALNLFTLSSASFSALASPGIAITFNEK